MADGGEISILGVVCLCGAPVAFGVARGESAATRRTARVCREAGTRTGELGVRTDQPSPHIFADVTSPRVDGFQSGNLRDLGSSCVRSGGRWCEDHQRELSHRECLRPRSPLGSSPRLPRCGLKSISLRTGSEAPSGWARDLVALVCRRGRAGPRSARAAQACVMHS